jgi:ankyrin repeat protein
MTAAILGNLDVVKLLMIAFNRCNCSDIVSKRNLNGYTALHYAAGSRRDSAIIKYLLQSCDSSTNTAIDFNAADKDGMTPLMLASHRGFKENVECLLGHSKEVRTDLTNKDNRTALALATSAGYTEVVTLLTKGRRSSSQNNSTSASSSFTTTATAATAGAGAGAGASAHRFAASSGGGASSSAAAALKKIDVIPSLIDDIMQRSDFAQADLKIIFQKILLLVQNIKNDFENPKFRSINKSSKLVQTYISPFPNIAAILTTIGFIETEERFELGYNITVDRLTFAIVFIEKAINRL